MTKNRSIALVTGASSGIGEALCRQLVQKGYEVIGVARSEDKLTHLQGELGQSFQPIVCDVADEQQVQQVSQKLLTTGKCPNLFFLNAGMTGNQVMENPGRLSVQKHRQILDVNYFGVLSWIEFWQQPCQDNGGATFMLTSSLNAIFAPPAASAYAGSKAGISKAFEGLSLTFFNTSLKFCVVYPGPVSTKGLKGEWPFTWTSEKMAKTMIRDALNGKRHCEPFLFYSTVLRLLRWLPPSWVLKMLRVSQS